MKTVYISGQITGLPIEEAKKNFRVVEKDIIEAGMKPVNPFKVSTFTPNKTWKDYMIDDIEALIRCDYIYMAKGWKKSKGALLEKIIAESLDIKFYFISSE
jgi:urease alpha subunit